MAALKLTTAKAWRLRAERAITLLFFVVRKVERSLRLRTCLARWYAGRERTGGNWLLTSSVSIWVINVLAFSLRYWQMDRGGPESRTNHMRADWLFPQDGVRDVPPDWLPTFLDYLYLAYSTATAFSSTDAMPLTSRAKMLMMLESAISLVTIVVVA